MTQDKISRKKRVARLKKIIVGTVAFFIFLPTFLCCILFVKVHSLQVKLNQVIQLKQQMAMELAAGHRDEMDGALDNEYMDNHELKQQTNTKPVNVKPDSEVYEGPRVYLTFDDGPSVNTDDILDKLAQYDAKATFFVVMQTDATSIERYKRILEEGHTLAMHSTSHIYSQVYSSLDAYISDVSQLQDYLYGITGVKPMFYRFPGGSSNTVSTVPIQECIEYLDGEDIKYFDWNVASGDADRANVSPSIISSNVINGITGRENSVVLLHDAAAKRSTVDALDAILTYCNENGYNVLPITDGTSLVHHRIM